MTSAYVIYILPLTHNIIVKGYGSANSRNKGNENKSIFHEVFGMLSPYAATPLQSATTGVLLVLCNRQHEFSLRFLVQ